MKRNRQRPASRPTSRTRPSGASPGRPRRWWLIVGALAGLVVVSVALWFQQGRCPLMAPPNIPLEKLSPAAAALIEQHLTAVRTTPQSGVAWGRLGAVLRSFDYRVEAGQCLTVAATLEPTEARWPYLHGLLLINRAPGEAVVHLRRAVSLCGNEPEVPRWRLAKLLAESGQWDEAQQQLNELLRARPEFRPATLVLAQVAMARNQFEEASRLARNCTTDSRTARAAWNLLGQLHQRQGAPDEAQSASQRAASLPADFAVIDPFENELSPARSDPRDLSDRAQRFLQSGALAQAAPLVNQLVREHPTFSEGWLLFGRWQVLNNDPVAAESSLRQHLLLDPQSVNGVFQLGMALMGQKRFAEAVPVFRQATQLKADFGPALYNLGFALVRSGQKREAIAPFREAIRHNPERLDSYVLLADLHWQLGERLEAEAVLLQAETVNPKDPRLATLRAKLNAP